ncbi:MAG: hypothetical protein ABI912_12170 [Actinomycetota bacterium]
MSAVRRGTLAALALLVAVWTFAITWEWSFIDDAGLKTAVNQYTHSKGAIGGLWDLFTDLQRSDRSWGLFRPAYQFWNTLFYLTNPALAHGIRLIMVLLVLLVPAYTIGRDRITIVLAVALLAANVTLYLGLSYLSLQELTGLAFVALGLVTGDRRRSVLWLIAAWFKTPFVWLFLAWSVYLLIKGKKWAWINLAVGVATVWLAAEASRRGSYTQGFSLANVRAAIKTAIPLFFWPGVVGLASVVALRPRLRTLAWRDPLAWVLLVGGALYLGNLLPWGHADSYYGAPPIWLMSVGVMRIIWPAERGTYRLARPIAAVATVVAVLGAVHVSRKMTTQQLNRNAAVVGVRDWAETIPADQPIALNAPEGAQRLGEILDFHGHPHVIAYIADTDASTATKYYIFFHDQSNGNPRLQQKVIRHFAFATIYQVD